jgi:glutamate/aspartate transport system substrate-binding protein
MVRRFFSFLAIGLTIGSHVSAASEPLEGTLKKIKETGAITLGYRESSIPFSYYDAKNNVVGFSQDLAQRVVEAIKKQLELPNLTVRRIPVTSQNRIPLVQNGTVDLEAGTTTATKAREEQVAFSNSFFIVSTRMLVKTDSPIANLSDLKRKPVVVTAGTNTEQLVRQLNQSQNLELSIISTKDHGESFLTLETGRAVAFFEDDVLLAGERAKSRNPNLWKIVGPPLLQGTYNMMLRKGDLQFKALVDKVLADLETSGEALKLYNQWFNQPIPPKEINMQFPPSEDLLKLYAAPNDRALQ